MAIPWLGFPLIESIVALPRAFHGKAAEIAKRDLEAKRLAGLALHRGLQTVHLSHILNLKACWRRFSCERCSAPVNHVSQLDRDVAKFLTNCSKSVLHMYFDIF